MQLISYHLPLDVTNIPNQPDPCNPHYFLHYAHRHTHSPVSTLNVAIENDIDMMVICTCSRR